METEQTTITPPPAPPTRIRVETAFSRFPIHCLSRKGTVTIDLQSLNDEGIADFKWEVTYNSKHGQPGPLAYKVDTLVINKILDQLGRPLPELVRIGSLSQVCRSLGTQDTGPNITNLRSAFLQNASAFINAKVRYKTKTGKERWAEIGYTRYSVIFTGEALPNGIQADAVHIVLNPPYRELLNHVETRPLDYDYLRSLPPGPQRFYELLSFKLYGAIAGARPRAKMLYSEYCKYAPQVKYGDFDHIKKQMYKLHLPHRESGYILKVDYRQIIGGSGDSDWEMLYTPGPKAFAEYRAFTNRHSQHADSNLLAGPPLKEARKPPQASLVFTGSNPDLLGELTKRGISEKKAADLLANLKPSQQVMDQLEYVDSIIAKDFRGKLENPPGLYVFYLRDNINPPPDFRASREANIQEKVQKLDREEQLRRSRLQIDYGRYREAEIEKFASALDRNEYKVLFAAHRAKNRAEFRLMTRMQLDELTHRTVRIELESSGRVPLMEFTEFCQHHQNGHHSAATE